MPAKRSYIMLTLVRCGDTQWERENRLHGSSDLPLSTVGRAAATADAEGLAGIRLATVYHPADEAAAETARAIAGATGARTKAVEGLADPSLGLYEGLLESGFAERYPKRAKQWEEDPLSFRPPEGEPMVDARGRVFRALNRLIRKSRSEEIAVVLHPIALGLLRCWLADEAAEHMWQRLDGRPRVERYVLPLTLVDRLKEVAQAEAVST